MKKNLLLTAVLLTAMIVSCTTTGGSGGGSSDEAMVLELKAEDAELVTTGQLQLEDANMNIGWWASTDDQIKWTLEVPEDGEYTVLYRYSLDPQFPGSVVKLTVGDQSLEYTMEDTGEWSNYRTLEVGKMSLKAGSQPVVIQAVSIENRFVMNLKSIKFMK
jgi:hypothetical protein